MRKAANSAGAGYSEGDHTFYLAPQTLLMEKDDGPAG